MSSTFDASILPTGAEANEPEVWWYKRDGKSHGPVSATTIAGLLAQSIVDRSTLIWREDFGSHWKRYDETSIWHQDSTPPGLDYGRWSKSFAKSEAKPKARQHSFLGLIFGPFYYLYLRMWSKGLVLLAVLLAISCVTAAIADATDTPNVSYSSLLVDIYCAWNVKRDYYRFRVLGEKIWPRVRLLGNPYAAGALCVALLIGTGYFVVDNDADSLASDISGVWSNNGATMIVNTDSSKPSMTLDGTKFPVRIKSVDVGSGIVVLTPVGHPDKPLTLRKRFDGNNKGFTLDLFAGESLIGNFGYIRPN